MSEKVDGKEAISEDELDQIIQDMSKEDEQSQAPIEAPEEAPLSVNASPKKTKPTVSEAGGSGLSLELGGISSLKLNFRNGERSVELQCGKDYLVCKLADGTEFRIPLGGSRLRKAA